MKKCPYCAEETQDEAIKCRFCMEFLDRPRSIPPPVPQETFPERAKNKEPWFFRKATVVTAVLCVGPLALPLIWWRPNTSRLTKLLLTIAILALSWVLTVVCIKSIRAMMTYYSFIMNNSY